MSYEYRLVFADELSAERVIDKVKSDASHVGSRGKFIYLKEPSVESAATYDVRMVKEGGNSIWLEVGFRSPGLYHLLKGAIADTPCACLDDGDPDDEVPLYEAFRLKQDPS